jgi:hypothetical protein
MIVEQLCPGFQWAEPFRNGSRFEVVQVGSELHIKGLLPLYLTESHPADLIKQYESAAKYRAVGQPRTAEESAEICFANADTDERLIAFVQRFGPVVATRVGDDFERLRTKKGLTEPHFPPYLVAVQDMQELRNEHCIFRSALALIMELAESDFDNLSARRLIGQIAAKIRDWPRQWEREKSERRKEPLWNLNIESRKRIDHLKSRQPDILLPPTLDGRIVICELLNSFRAIVFPNQSELHSSIKYGIRPLLYSLLRRRFLAPRDFSTCSNTQCRNFFDIERAGQRFCCTECSIHQRQRVYWAKRGSKLRKKRLRKREERTK